MITGYNTDVEFDGVVYHVQTEDKGLQTPIILSLVYTGGAILASKRSPYDDLVARGFDEEVLSRRLQRQHKLICAAVHAGRIEDLKRMGAAASSEESPESRQGTAEDRAASEPMETAGVETRIAEKRAETAIAGGRILPSESAEKDGPAISLLEETTLRAGESALLRVQVTRATRNGREPAAKARVIVKILGTTFRPTIMATSTGPDGTASISVAIPSFRNGRAALLMQAEVEDQTVELRRIILPEQSS